MVSHIRKRWNHCCWFFGFRDFLNETMSGCTLPEVFWTINNDLPTIQILPCDKEKYFYVETDWVPCFRRLFSELWLRRPGFVPSLCHGNFVVNKFRNGTGFSHVLLFTLLLQFLPVLHIYLFIHYRRFIIIVLDNIVKQRTWNTLEFSELYSHALYRLFFLWRRFQHKNICTFWNYEYGRWGQGMSCHLLLYANKV